MSSGKWPPFCCGVDMLKALIFSFRFTCALVYFGLSLNVGNMAGDPYLNFFFSGLVEFPSAFITAPILQLWAINEITHWSMEDVVMILEIWFRNSWYRILAWALAVKLRLGECHKTLHITSWHCFRRCFGAVRLQAIIGASAYWKLCRHKASICHNGLNDTQPNNNFLTIVAIVIFVTNIIILISILVCWCYHQ